jgi:hypothetical protein
LTKKERLLTFNLSFGGILSLTQDKKISFYSVKKGQTFSGRPFTGVNQKEKDDACQEDR